MSSPDDVLQDLERDREQREAEIRLVENLATRSTSDAERSMLRRSLVLLTYAHLEGFCKFALFAYVAAVNAARVPCREAAVPLVAATLTKVFGALREINRKHPVFARALPDDQRLHMSAREQRFVEEFENITAHLVEIPDNVVDTESNLNAVVLKKILFQLGLNFASVDAHSNTIGRLLGFRNAIAHGDAIKVPRDREAKEFLVSTFEIMGLVQTEIYDALRREAYRRNVA
ncbi:MAG: MAE_28990/MAE_18760 family HEPN-like nuclease [Acetobacteraceae bacterium]